MWHFCCASHVFATCHRQLLLPSSTTQVRALFYLHFLLPNLANLVEHCFHYGMHGMDRIHKNSCSNSLNAKCVPQRSVVHCMCTTSNNEGNLDTHTNSGFIATICMCFKCYTVGSAAVTCVTNCNATPELLLTTSINLPN